MEYPGINLLDETGKPFSTRIERVLHDLLPRLRRQFPALNDEVCISEVLEEAGRRIADHESRSGPIEKLHGYAWVAVRSVALSRMRLSSTRLARATLGSEQSQTVLSSVPSLAGSPKHIENDVLLREALTHLNSDERLICVWKKAGFSSKEIAKYRGGSVEAIDTLFSRAKQKIRKILGVQEPERRVKNG